MYTHLVFTTVLFHGSHLDPSLCVVVDHPGVVIPEYILGLLKGCRVCNRRYLGPALLLELGNCLSLWQGNNQSLVVQSLETVFALPNTIKVSKYNSWLPIYCY